VAVPESEYLRETGPIGMNIAVEPQGLAIFGDSPPSVGDDLIVRTLLHRQEIEIRDQQGNVVARGIDGEDATDDTASVEWTPETAGTFEIWAGGWKRGEIDIAAHGTNPLAPGADQRAKDDPLAGLDDPIEPENYGMIVNADNESGIALAPSAVREGISADPGGTEVDLSDGTTVTVYPREDADEAIRDTETGDAIDSPVGSGGVEGGVGGSSSGGSGGMIGGAVAVVLALVVAGAAALLGDGD
jgi:hypothetical protein